MRTAESTELNLTAMETDARNRILSIPPSLYGVFAPGWDDASLGDRLERLYLQEIEALKECSDQV